jgi:hypothetical protein
MSHSMPDKWIDDFVAMIEKATIAHNTHKEATALKNSHLPSKIYKYRRDNDCSRANLDNNLVWMASPNTYNDPFDCLFKVDEEQAIREYKKTVHAMTFSITSSAAEAQMAKVIAQGVKFLHDIRDNLKVCSFSAANDSLLMWGHYASDHKGFCIEYNLEPLPADDFLRRVLYPVIYSKDLYDMTPLVKGAVAENTSDFPFLGPILCVLHKFEGWSYEREWRLVQFNDHLKKDHTHSVPKPTKVFLGKMIDAKNAAEIAAICANQGIKVLKMELAPDKFELVARPYPAP